MNEPRQRQSLRIAAWGFLFLPVLFSVVATPRLRAATYYVAKTGSDSASGSLTAPFLSINRGISALQSGGTLSIRGGTYAESLGDGIPSGTSWSAPTTLAAYPGETVILRPPSGASRIVSFSSARFIVLDGFIMDGANLSSDGIKISHAGTNTAEYIRIRNSELKYAPAQGILVSGDSRGNEFINLKVHHNGGLRGDLNHGFYIEGANNLVERCDIYNNTGKGVQIYKEGGGAVDNNIVRYNKIHDNAKPGPRGVGIILSTGRGNKAHDNLIWGNSGGIQVDYGSDGAMIFNNTIFSNDGPAAQYGISLSGTGVNTVVRNNIVFQNSGGNITGSQSGQVLSNNLTSDPLFINSAGLDFHLGPGSPAIDAGINLSASGVTVDFAGTPRPLGAAYDIGAYEYAGTAPPPTADATPPVLGAVAASAVGPTGATIGWTTNEAADAQVDYGPTTAYGASSVLNTSLSTSHSAVLGGLTAGTPYHYRVKSRDAAGNLATSADFTFTTTAFADTTPPVLSAVAASAVSQTGATIGWTTNEAADAQVDYGPTTAYGGSTVLSSALSTSHSAVLGGLTAGTVYHYRVKSRDAAGNLAASPDGAFTTAAFVPAVGCVNSAAAWQNVSLPVQTGSFSVEYDAVPGTANMDGVSGLSNGAAAAYAGLAAAVRFNNTGMIDVRNGGGYAASVALPYVAGLTYHVRLVVDIPAHTYSAYVRQGSNTEQPVGQGYAFRTEQAAVSTLNNVGLFASTGSEQVCGAAVTVSGPPADTTAPVLSGVAASPVGQTDATIAWSTNEAADTQVDYGPSTAYGASTVLSPSLSTSHSAVLGGLTVGTLYHYRVKSKDAAGNLAASADFTFTTAVPADSTPPVLSAVAASAVSQTGATIGWTTNEAADTQVDYGPTAAYGASTVLNSSLSTGHSAALSALTAGTLYHYRVKSKDAAGNLAASADTTFTTAAPADTTPPVLSAVAASGVGQTSATIGWTTDEAADTQVEYGPTAGYGASTFLNAALTTSHSVAIGGLTAGTLYHYRVKSKDAAGNLAASADTTFATAPPPAPTACINSAGAWANAALTPQTGAFIAEFDAVPGTAKMDGVIGLSNGAAAEYTGLTAIVRFNNSGYIDARNGGAYAAASSIPYAAGQSYRFRLDINLSSRKYSAYVREGANVERLLGSGYNFRSEPLTGASLNNLAAYASAGSLAVCGVAVK